MKKILLPLLLILNFISHNIAFGQWTNIAHPGTDIFITSENRGFMFESFWGPPYAPNHSGMYKIWHTDNSWATLSLVEQFTGSTMGCCSIKDVFFVNDSTGFKAVNDQGNISLYLTTNKGNTWNNVNTGGASSYGFSMFFLNKDNGYISHFPGSGNSSYLNRYNNGNGINVYSTRKYQFRDRGMYFINDSTGFILCVDSLQKNVCIRTTDFGHTWDSVLTSNSISFNDFCVSPSNENICFIAGDSGILYKSTDAGINWSTITSGTTTDLNSICFINDNKGYASGNSGLIIVTFDGGVNWFQQTCPVADNLLKMKFVNTQTGFISAFGGALLKTTNGGDYVENYLNEEEITVFPNPSSGKLTIKLSDLRKDLSFELYNSCGVLILKGIIQENDINLDLTDSGLYFLKVISQNRNFHKKIIIY
jgi:photosystem II stability/assembly factor-like uncharacterized protein